MPLTLAKCTACGANLEVDNAKDAAICPFCGSAYVVEKAINHYYTTNNINAATVNVLGASADALFKDAETFEALGAFDDASKKYMQMMEEFPADPRGSIGVVRLAIEHHTALGGGKTQLAPLNIALKLGNKEFLNWLYQNFDRDEQVVLAGVNYVRNLGADLGDKEFITRLNQYFEKKCRRIRSGESSIEHEFPIGWDVNNKQLRTMCDCLPCVRVLLDEAKSNAIYFNSQIDKIGDRSYRKVYSGVIERLWGPRYTSDFIGPLDGGIIGNTYYCEYDGSAGYTAHFYKLHKVVAKNEIDSLFQEINRCNTEGICPYCGIGRKGFFSNKCNHCGRRM